MCLVAQVLQGTGSRNKYCSPAQAGRAQLQSVPLYAPPSQVQKRGKAVAIMPKGTNNFRFSSRIGTDTETPKSRSRTRLMTVQIFEEGVFPPAEINSKKKIHGSPGIKKESVKNPGI